MNATQRPSPEIEGKPESPFAGLSSSATLTSSIAPVVRSCTKMSPRPFESPATRLVALLWNATKAPFEETTPPELGPLAAAPVGPLETRIVSSARANVARTATSTTPSVRRMRCVIVGAPSEPEGEVETGGKRHAVARSGVDLEDLKVRVHSREELVRGDAAAQGSAGRRQREKDREVGIEQQVAPPRSRNRRRLRSDQEYRDRPSARRVSEVHVDEPIQLRNDVDREGRHSVRSRPAGAVVLPRRRIQSALPEVDVPADGRGRHQVRCAAGQRDEAAVDRAARRAALVVGLRAVGRDALERAETERPAVGDDVGETVRVLQQEVGGAGLEED